jgi:serine/threonine-protein kinase
MHSSSVFILSLFTSIVAAGGTVYSIQRFHLLPAEPSAALPQVSLPKLEGLSEEDARSNLAALGLPMIIGERRASPGAKPGTVVTQSVATGASVEKGTAITVAIAEAVPVVPDLSGKSQAEATALLEPLGYKLQISGTSPHATIETGLVVSQEPVSGESPAGEGPILVRLSAGPSEVEVPKVAGFTINNAKKLLAEAGLEAEVQWTARAETMEYLVLQQTPKPGEKLEAGSKVRLVVNSGD